MDTDQTLPTHVRTLVVGAGFGGLAVAIKLHEQGRSDFLVLERGSDVGGTWRDNTYPGAACDVPSQLYSYSFALNPDWSRSFSPQPEIQAYIRKVATESGVLDRFAFHTSLTDATWDEQAQVWRVTTDRGELTADVLVSAAGALSDPKDPDIEGFDSFEGEVFHSARWNHDYDLTGKRVAVIGTGASSIQIVPAIAEQVAHLDVYQRTAPWVLPRHDRDYTALERLAFKHVPGVQRAYRTAIYWGREMYVPAFTKWPKLATPAKLMALKNIEKGISDPELRRKVTPDYEIGCKRILISNGYYPALDRDDVDLVTEGIARVTPTGIVDREGVEREVDAIIVATGFHTTDLPIASHVTGLGGVTLADHFAEHGMQAYKGSTVNGFPNLFFVVGPNTGLGHSSMVFMIESQVAYVLDALKHLEQEGVTALQPRAEVQADYVQDLQDRMTTTVWSAGGCASWYLDSHGRNVTLWPRATFTFRRLLSSFDRDSYEVVSPAPLPTTPQAEEVFA
ncbi:flavin-containing monooxygenase [Nocardioides marmoribigeumensis]|uniref:Cyclohexanone monooxygenase n=1 Tax=Nocardioides marmoribigeumensis TaxID=433649 RepID=A0ABU2C1X6_9ACTN|nr:NAD(P)/FAD-dependent oxidoreductase [Nocardioides marmoribigeumensis]MDR7364650.1 cyclohexanone monooxygenase [Nocardioides marmoribigeumensis]